MQSTATNSIRHDVSSKFLAAALFFTYFDLSSLEGETTTHPNQHTRESLVPTQNMNKLNNTDKKRKKKERNH